jgi:putative transposase
MVKRKSPIIRTDKWLLNPTDEHRHYLDLTVKEFRRLVRSLVGVIYVHWSYLGSLPGEKQIGAVERLIHHTDDNPNPRYHSFDQSFHKFPSYYRRGAIQFALGQVSSFVTRYNEWQGGIRSRRDAKPPRLNAETSTYPPLYQGQCIKFSDNYKTAAIKVFTGKDWVWVTMPVTGHRHRHLVDTNQRLSPYLIVNESRCHLSVPFQCRPIKRTKSDVVVAVDLGINTTATVVVVDQRGTVIHREFIHRGRDIDRRDQRLGRIRRKARLTMGRGGNLHKGFCKSVYRKCRHINQNIAHHVSKRIAAIAAQFGAKVIVLEQMKGWRPKGGKKRSALRQRFHGWLHRMIANFTQQKWEEQGGEVAYVNPAYTSKYAYDGSGLVKRDKQNYALALFKTGKQYSADLNGALNIASRYLYQLLRGNSQEVWVGKSSPPTPRIPVTLSLLWCQPSSV